jgi:hypothetical protein
MRPRHDRPPPHLQEICNALCRDSAGRTLGPVAAALDIIEWERNMSKNNQTARLSAMTARGGRAEATDSDSRPDRGHANQRRPFYRRFYWIEAARRPHYAEGVSRFRK